MQFPFFRKARPAQTRSSPWLGGWSAATPPRSYEAQVRAGFIVNPIVSRAVRIVADGMAGAPIVSTPAAHPALALFGRDGSVLETIAANLLLHGNAYVEIACGATGLPVALYPLRPERIAEDRIDVGLASWRAGDLPSVPLVEVREA